MLRNAMVRVRGDKFPDKKCYEDILFNDISAMKGWVGVKFPDQKCYEDVPLNDISVTRGWVGEWMYNFQKKTSRGCTDVRY